MSRRGQIVLTDAELAAFLEEQRVVTCATTGRDGWPHLMPLWYVVREGRLWAWTFAKSQKTKNLERDPRATLLVEAGETYDQLRGVMIEAEAELVADFDAVLALGRELGSRYAPGAEGPEAEAALAHQAGKRMAIRFRPRRVVSWDHRKL